MSLFFDTTDRAQFVHGLLMLRQCRALFEFPIQISRAFVSMVREQWTH